MLRHDLKLGLRNLKKNKSFSLINVLGLSISLACCITIGLYAYTEFSFDKFNKHHNDIYRINKITNEKGKEPQKDALTPGKLAAALRQEIPEIQAATKFRPWFNEMLVSHDTIHFKLDNVAYADASFLNVFDFPLLQGNKITALAEPGTAVITESTAKKYFGNEDAMGKTFTTLNNIPVKITGVAKDVPHTSSVQFTMLISWATIESPANSNYFGWMNSWTSHTDYSFVQLKPNTNPQIVGNKISVLLHKNLPENAFQYRNYLQPLDQIHLNPKDVLYAEPFKTNSSNIIFTLLIIAAFILLIAGFNFINLTTAGALSRAKETGVQKVLGAKQGQLILKFFIESFLMCFISILLSLVIVNFLLPFFNELANASLHAELLLQPEVVISLLALLLLLSLIAGLYPAFFLSRFRATDVFRNIIKSGNDSWLRKLLVTTQFALSILLIIITIVVNSQVHYLETKDLGFDKEQVVVLRLTNTNLETKCKEFVKALKQFPNILSASITNRVPGQGFTDYGIIPEGHTLDEHFQANVLETDADFANTYDIPVVQGRYFSSQMPTDTTNSIVINEAMAKYLGWNNPVGKELEIYQAKKGKVIGVLKDFNFASLRETIQPLALILNNNPLYLSVKLKAGSVQPSLKFLEAEWKQFDNEYPFDFFFLNEQLDRFYQSDFRLLNALNILSCIAIFIACIGLFGLSIYSARQRTKEIGIRKVLGASILQIASLVGKDFVVLIIIAIFIASPIAWWASNAWLQDFANRISMSPWIFFAAGISAIIIALVTVSFQAIKAANANPVESLRIE
jgi:putative ABC transport system permease protein